MAKNTVLTLAKQVAEGQKVTMVTSYDYSMASIVEAAGINMILVGDSLGMTMLGYEDTIPVTMDDMVHHPRDLAEFITSKLTHCFTIGIGAGAGCDGQVLVAQDLLGMTPGGFKPKFVRQFAQVGDTIHQAYEDYAEAVQSGEFPAFENGFKMNPEVMDQIRRNN